MNNPREKDSNIGTMIAAWSDGNESEWLGDVADVQTDGLLITLSDGRQIKGADVPDMAERSPAWLPLYNYGPGKWLSVNETNPLDIQGWGTDFFGYTIAEEERVFEKLGWASISPKRELELEEMLAAEVEEYNEYLQWLQTDGGES